MLILQEITYEHPDHETLFEGVNLNLNVGERAAIVGNNGSGKSTLLKIIAGLTTVSSGTITRDALPYYLPQHLGQLNNLSVGEALGVDRKINALHRIMCGEMDDYLTTDLADDWTIEERCQEALADWGLHQVKFADRLDRFSGGEKARILLSGIAIHNPSLILLDEPTNHLDWKGRQKLYNFLRANKTTILLVSHDRTLLNGLDIMYELSAQGITRYGGNYDFYAQQKAIEMEAVKEGIRTSGKMLRDARKAQRETLERKQKLDARGKRKQEKSGVPTIMLNTLRNQAQRSTAKLKDTHLGKIEGITDKLSQLRDELPPPDQMRLKFDGSQLHTGKHLIELSGVMHQFGPVELWKQPLDLLLTSGDRIGIKGVNGSGKTTLLRIMLGELRPTHGTVKRSTDSVVYLDQDYSLVDDEKTVTGQAMTFNTGNLLDHEVKIWLTRFLFPADSWDKRCKDLSGGEKMRLALCCLMIRNLQPDIIVLDEPTNNLDLSNVHILTNAIANYDGTVIVISHDEVFMKEINVKRQIDLDALNA